MIYTHLNVDPARAKLAYRVYVDGYSAAALTPLTDAGDWHRAMDKVGSEFENSFDVELEVLDVNNAVSVVSTSLYSMVLTR
jgi:hypothetical protein